MAANSDLTSFTVSLPRGQKEYLQRQAVVTGCSTPSEYVRRLIHADQVAQDPFYRPSLGDAPRSA